MNTLSQTIDFRGIKSKKIQADFSGGKITSDAGAILLRKAERKTSLIRDISKSIVDTRNQAYVEHDLNTMLTQRVMAIACGYEDGNDHNYLKSDSFFKIVNNKCTSDKDLASPSTLCRLENNVSRADLVEMSKVFVEQFIASFDTAPKELVLDFDATDSILHGNQEGKFFHGYYDNYCYLPLYVFCDHKLLVSYLRPSNIDAAKHSKGILKLLVNRLRQQWPKVKIIFRGDSGFCRHKMLDWCDCNDVGYIVGIAKNNSLLSCAKEIIERSRELYTQKKKKVRHFGCIEYAAKTWSRTRRVIVKAEQLIKGENIRFVVTNLNGTPEKLYDKVYTARGDMENRIKEQQLDLFADRTSCKSFNANQFRLLLASAAYVLLEYIRSTALKGTELANAYCSTIRLKLLKIGAVILENSRRIMIRMSETYPYRSIFLAAVENLN